MKIPLCFCRQEFCYAIFPQGEKSRSVNVKRYCRWCCERWMDIGDIAPFKNCFRRMHDTIYIGFVGFADGLPGEAQFIRQVCLDVAGGTARGGPSEHLRKMPIEGGTHAPRPDGSRGQSNAAIGAVYVVFVSVCAVSRAFSAIVSVNHTTKYILLESYLVHRISQPRGLFVPCPRSRSINRRGKESAEFLGESSVRDKVCPLLLI